MVKKNYSRHILSLLSVALLFSCTAKDVKKGNNNLFPSLNKASGGLINPLTYEELVNYSSSSVTRRVVMGIKQTEQMSNATKMKLFTNTERYYDVVSIPYYEGCAINLDDNLNIYSNAVMNMYFSNSMTSGTSFTLLNIANYQYFADITGYTFTDYQSSAMDFQFIEGDDGGIYLSHNNQYLYYDDVSLSFNEDAKSEFYFYEINLDFIKDYTWFGFLNFLSSSMNEDEMKNAYLNLPSYQKHFLISNPFTSSHMGDIQEAWNLFSANYSIYLDKTNSFFNVLEPQGSDFSIDYDKMIIKSENKKDNLYALIGEDADQYYMPLEKTLYGDYLLVGNDYSLLGGSFNLYYGILEEDKDYFSEQSVTLSFKEEQQVAEISEETASFKVIDADDQTYTTEYLFDDSFTLNEEWYGNTYDFALIDAAMFFVTGFDYIQEIDPYLYQYQSSYTFDSYQDVNFIQREGLIEGHQFVLIMRFKEDDTSAPSKPVHYALIDTPSKETSFFKHALIDNYEAYSKYYNSDRFMDVRWRSEIEEIKAYNKDMKDMIIGYERDMDIEGLSAYLEAQSFDHRYYIQFSYYLILVKRYDYSSYLPDDHKENYYAAANEFLAKYEEEDFTSYEQIDLEVDNYIASCQAVSDDYEAIYRTKYNMIEATNSFLDRNILTLEETNNILDTLKIYLKRIDEETINLYGDQLKSTLKNIYYEYCNYLMNFITNGGNDNGR